MKAPPFRYARPETVAEAVRLLAEHPGARILAGGQSLVATLQMRLSAPVLVIDINRIPGLDSIRRAGDRLLIGALVRHAQTAGSALVAEHCPLVAAAMPHVAHAAIRNRGTTCGSLANADPAAEMPACAVALDALLEISGPGGARSVPARSFYSGLFETDLAEDELLTGVSLPVAAPGERFVFDEIARRHGDFPEVGLAARRRAEGGRTVALDLVIFGPEPCPRPSAAAREIALHRPFDAACIAEITAAVTAEMEPMAHAAVRRLQAGALLRRCLPRLADGPPDHLKNENHQQGIPA
ncbi:xanthine dehydrogenase family protein subunit M (plasmid) [Paroceanicella profunda]|uniref:Xanthine dehydrogenase family protein subunit M n=1 Tax=Paroceanicella profunda TaxID=2579971 RepID=A0A5B8G5B6_9RHOB|nr:FAD binding domain-containing protein [Paroceanicella profunda]QDL94539.1 xanthine dehydrogenase family protein subunit M [Paroceanicella profunda]QDL94679.1 xanthine dehydrogenase family protein subunit M [Paroceanicella profunda]